MPAIALRYLDSGTTGLLNQQVRQTVTLLCPLQPVVIPGLRRGHRVRITILDKRRLIIAAILGQRQIIAVAFLENDRSVVGNSALGLRDSRVVRIALLRQIQDIFASALLFDVRDIVVALL